MCVLTHSERHDEVRSRTCRGQLPEPFECRLVLNPVERQQGKVPVRELIPERAGKDPARMKRHESECLQAGRDEVSRIDCFALAADLDDHDLGTAARVERHANDLSGRATTGENVRHACPEMCKKHTRETWRVRARAGRGIEESSIE